MMGRSVTKQSLKARTFTPGGVVSGLRSSATAVGVVPGATAVGVVASTGAPSSVGAGPTAVSGAVST